MNPDVWVQAVSTVGFPIVCCGAMFWNMVTLNKQHQEEMNKMSEALNNNTIALTKLTERIHREEGGITWM